MCVSRASVVPPFAGAAPRIAASIGSEWRHCDDTAVVLGSLGSDGRSANRIVLLSNEFETVQRLFNIRSDERRIRNVVDLCPTFEIDHEQRELLERPAVAYGDRGRKCRDRAHASDPGSSVARGRTPAICAGFGLRLFSWIRGGRRKLCADRSKFIEEPVEIPGSVSAIGR
jgi:hypothetical protein